VKSKIHASQIDIINVLESRMEPEISIASARPASTNEWDSSWAVCPYATFFHSRKWIELWCEYNEGHITPEPIAVEFSDGKKAIIPMARKTAYKGLISTLISAPMGTYGGWISSDMLGGKHVQAMVEYLLSRDSLRWRINPFDINTPVFLATDTDTGIPGAGTPDISMDYTYVVDTTAGFDAVEAAISKSNLRSIHRAFRLGIEVFEARSEKEWADYFDIYGDALRRWGANATSNYSKMFFEKMRKIGSPHVQLRLAVYKNRPIAGALFLKSPRHISIWHAATRTDSLHLSPFNMLVYFALEEACRTGITWLDFNPSGGHEGVSHSKERFGSAKLPCPEIVIKSWFNYYAEPSLKMLSKIKSGIETNIKARRIGGKTDVAA
jgi:hypothetical protein